MNIPRMIKSMSSDERKDLFMELANYADEIATDQSKSLELVAASDFMPEIKDELENWGKHRGLSFGITGVDQMTLGMTDGEILLLSGDSNHGKSQLAFNMAYRQALQDKLVFFITLEMTKPQAGARIAKIALQDGKSMDDIELILGRIIFQKVDKLDYRMVYPIVKRAKDDGASIVFLDHVHYFARSAESNKTNEVAAISMEIKRAALTCKIPIVALCQCRKLDDGKGKSRKPTKMDLKDAAELYQDCDLCIMVWRDKDNPNANPNLVEARIWKNRLRAMRSEHLIKNFISVEGALLRETDVRVVKNIRQGEWFDQARVVVENRVEVKQLPPAEQPNSEPVTVPLF